MKCCRTIFKSFIALTNKTDLFLTNKVLYSVLSWHSPRTGTRKEKLFWYAGILLVKISASWLKLQHTQVCYYTTLIQKPLYSHSLLPGNWFITKNMEWESKDWAVKWIGRLLTVTLSAMLFALHKDLWLRKWKKEVCLSVSECVCERDTERQEHYGFLDLLYTFKCLQLLLIKMNMFSNRKCVVGGK